jgi:hypothetical protein
VNLVELKQRAERVVQLEYGAWADLTGAQRTSLIYRKMLQLLEEDGKDLLRSTLLVARDALETGAWSWGGESSFVEFLCEAGGRYRQEDGMPSGAAYDLANYVAVAWPVLEAAGYNPLDLASRSWSKARMTVATIRASVTMLADGQEVTRPEDATTIRVRPEAAGEVERVVRLALDGDISSREMAHEVQGRRVPPFTLLSVLEKDGTWYIYARGLTEVQYQLATRLLGNHAEVHLE